MKKQNISDYDAALVERYELLLGNEDRTGVEEQELRKLEPEMHRLFPKSYPKFTCAPKWFRVREKNDWGIVTTFVGRKPFVHTKNRIKVLFPDGHEEIVPFLRRSVTVQVSDHGRKLSIPSLIPYVRIQIHGLPVEIRLGESHLKVAV